MQYTRPYNEDQYLPVTPPGPTGAPVPTRPPVPTGPPQDFTGHAGHVLGGGFLDEGNPYTQGLLDRSRREAEQTYNSARSQLMDTLSGAGRFGGDVGNNMAAQLFGQHATALGDTQNSMLANLFENERNRMTQTLGMLGSHDVGMRGHDVSYDLGMRGHDVAREVGLAGVAMQETVANINAATRRAEAAARSGDIRAQIAAQQDIAQLEAQLARDMQANQLGFDRESLALQGMLGFGDQALREQQLLGDLIGMGMAADQNMLGLAGQMGSGIGSQQLAALGLVPGLDAANYFGLGQALTGQQAVDQANAHAAAQQHAANMAAWQHDRYNDQQALDDYVRTLMGIGSMGGTAATQGVSPGQPAGPTPDPWASGLLGGLGGYLGLRDMFPPRDGGGGDQVDMYGSM